jgi:exodeoxyribonuclease VII small subunit
MAICRWPISTEKSTISPASTGVKWARSPTPLPQFEDSLQRLEKIVDQLEKGNVPLEHALKLFEEGVQLSSSCRKELEEAEGKVEILLKQNGKLQAAPYEAEKSAAANKK